MSSDKEPSIAVVIPAYRVAPQIVPLLARIPSIVRHVIVIDDASPDNLQQVLKKVSDARVIVLRHEKNQGVGATMKTGFAKALELEADIIVKIDGDGQMDPELIPKFIQPVVENKADFTKGNRFVDLLFIKRMPLIRRLGNVALSFLVKMASGYWHAFDPTNGYVAIRAETLKSMLLRRVADRYFFEISLLCEAYFARAVLQDIPMKPHYGHESSSLNPAMIVFEFTPKLIVRILYRIMTAYFLRDFNVASLFLLFGLPLFLFGVVWSLCHWIQVVQTNIVASTGTVMIGALAIILGFQLLLQGMVLDVQNEPKK